MITDKERLGVLSGGTASEVLVSSGQVANYCPRCGLSSFRSDKRCVRCWHLVDVKSELISLRDDGSRHLW